MKPTPTKPKTEKAVLIAVDTGKGWSCDASLEELTELARTAHAEVVGKLTQKLTEPHPVTYFGKGKINDLIHHINETHCDLVIVDDELDPTQQRNLEKTLNIKIIDRVALILDIFAERAQTKEGKLQVELAQMQYLLPRLAGQWSHLERLGGGIGTRGPGESQLESDKRVIRKKISKTKRDIEEVRKHRQLLRSNRTLPIVSLVGYTNAGKSSLLNVLTKSDVYAENKLFATLDPTVRKRRLDSGKTILLTDTVGFIQKLPPQIVDAFKATLEELNDADLLLHVVDITNPFAADQYETVMSILKDIKVSDKPIITVLNKSDLLDKDELLDSPDEEAEYTVLVSAKTGEGLDNLLKLIDELLQKSMQDQNSV